MHTATQLLFFILGVVTGEAARQLGRAILGLAAGLRLAHVALGAGPLLLRLRLGGALLMVRPVPIFASAGWMPPDRPSWLRLRLWLLVAGGPAASIAVLWAIRAGGVPFHGTGGALWWVQALAMGILVNLIGRLFPYSMRNGDELVPSDGLQLWRVLTASAGELRASFVPSFAVEASIELGFGHPKLALVAAERGQVAGDARTAPLFWLLQASAHSNLGDPAKGRALAANALAADLAPSLRSLALNDWSWHAFRARDDGDLRLADQRSAEALGVHAKSPAVSGTRAAILLWRGRVGQAIPLLEKALATSRLPRASASDACLLAMAHASRGESVRAQSLLERARRLVPEHPLLAEAGRYVGAAVAGLRVLYASRGRRALLVEPDGVELLEGVVGRFDDRETLRAAAARRQRLTLSEIDEVRVTRGRGGRAYLFVSHAGRSWRLPLAEADLMWARMLADDVRNHPPARVSVAPAVGARPERVTKLIPLLGIAMMAMVVLDAPGRYLVVSLPSLSLALVLLLRPGVPAALAFGLVALARVALVSGWFDPLRVLSPRALLGAGLVAALGGLALLASWLAAREGDRARAGFRAVVAALAWPLVFHAVLGLHARSRGIDGWSLLRADFIPSLLALVAVVIWRTRTKRPARPAR